MADNKPPPSLLDWATKAVTLVSLALAAYAAGVAIPADAEIKRLQGEMQRLDLALKKADADLKNLESNRKVTLELYQEVKKVIEKKDKDSREEDAVRVLVESLADDPFRWKLLGVIAVGAKDLSVKETAAATSKFYQEDAQTQLPSSNTADAKSNTAAANPLETGIGSYNIDFFFCEKKQPTSKPLAQAALSLKSASDTGQWRIRALPESINQQPGYSIQSNVIRFTPPDERPVADALAKALATKGIKVQFQEISYPTPKYVSVFICQ
jgi:hypothetical protein